MVHSFGSDVLLTLFDRSPFALSMVYTPTMQPTIMADVPQSKAKLAVCEYYMLDAPLAHLYLVNLLDLDSPFQDHQCAFNSTNGMSEWHGNWKHDPLMDQLTAKFNWEGKTSSEGKA